MREFEQCVSSNINQDCTSQPASLEQAQLVNYKLGIETGYLAKYKHLIKVYCRAAVGGDSREA